VGGSALARFSEVLCDGGVAGANSLLEGTGEDGKSIAFGVPCFGEAEAEADGEAGKKCSSWSLDFPGVPGSVALVGAFAPDNGALDGKLVP